MSGRGGRGGGMPRGGGGRGRGIPRGGGMPRGGGGRGRGIPRGGGMPRGGGGRGRGMPRGGGGGRGGSGRGRGGGSGRGGGGWGGWGGGGWGSGWGYHHPRWGYRGWRPWYQGSYVYDYPQSYYVNYYDDIDVADVSNTPEPPYYLIGKKLVRIGEKPIELLDRNVTQETLAKYAFESDFPKPYIILEPRQTVYGYESDRLKVFVDRNDVITDVYYG